MTRLGPLLVALALTGCSSQDAPRPGRVTGSGLRDAVAAPGSSSAPAGPSGSAAAASPSSAPADAGGASTPEPTAAPDGYRPITYPNNTMPLEVKVVPDCGRRGAAMKAVVQTRPNVVIGVATQYSDPDYRPDFPSAPGYSDASGRYEWSWVIRPDAPFGSGFVRVAAGRSKVGQAAGEARFFVKDAC
ncbi:MAG TPA: hypothetical protein VNE62_10570 [Actinomycetota bacterium]|nr:hypothetical protein [Actinomycetota bacterium]